MHEKLASLFHLFKSAQAEGLSIESAIKTPSISVQINEILAIFGLPPIAEHVAILIGFGKLENLTDAAMDDTLVRLADAGAYHLTMENLSGI